MGGRMGLPTSTVTYQDAYERDYPYVLFPYLISENDTIAQLKGRIFLDQDLQEAVSSLLSSCVTQARRAAGLYFAKDTDDPNDDWLMEKNIYFKQGALIPKKVTSFKLDAPDPGIFSAINLLVSTNQNETSQTNFAVNNRKDSRKTAEEIKTANQQQQLLSTVQVVLFSIALTQLYRKMVDIIVSRVKAGVIKVNNQVMPLYSRTFSIKPSGDVDVIERQQLLNQMMQAWPVIQATPMAEAFLMDMMEMMFPDRFPKYQAAMMQAKQASQQQQSGQQAQMIQGLLGEVKQLADGIMELDKHPEFWSESGKIYAKPLVEIASDRIKEFKKNMMQSSKPSNGNGQAPTGQQLALTQ